VRRLFLAVPCVVVAFAGTASAANITVGDGANGHTVRLHRGDVLAVALRGNVTTGYTWDTEAVDTKILHQLRTQWHYVYPKNPRLIGGGHDITRFRFRARAAGRTTIRLVYHQGRGHVAKRFRLVVLVR